MVLILLCLFTASSKPDILGNSRLDNNTFHCPWLEGFTAVKRNLNDVRPRANIIIVTSLHVPQFKIILSQKFLYICKCPVE